MSDDFSATYRKDRRTNKTGIISSEQTHERGLIYSYLWFLSKALSWKTTWKQSKEGFDKKKRNSSSVQKNPSLCPVCPHKVVRLQKRCAAVSARSSNTSPVCVKVSGASNLLDTQSGGQVFHSDVINHSAHNTVVNTALCLCYADFCLRAAEARFQRQRQDFFSFNSDMG